MFDHPHHHHDHEGDHDAHVEIEQDVAGKSLSDALRVSFRLLTAIMVLVLIAFVLTGVQVVHANQAGIRKVFGKVVGVASQGLTFTWPYPIGEMEIIDVSPRTLHVDDLWMYESPEDKLKQPSDRKPVADGLRPGYDGAVFTADRSLLHVQFVAVYQVRDALACRKGVHVEPGRTPETAMDAIVGQMTTGAAVEVAASRQADMIRNAPTDFARDVRTRAERRLNSLLGAGAIAITGLTARVEWPLQALGAFQNAQNAAREYDTKVQTAITEADNMLKAAAGAEYTRLVAQPWAPVTSRPADDGSAPYDLIGQYVRVRQELDETDATNRDELAARQAQLQTQIDKVLDENVAGEAAGIRDRARAARTQLVSTAQERLRLFQKTLPAYLRAPELTMERLWVQTREEILGGPLVEKYYLSPGDELVLRLSADPEFRKQIDLEAIKRSRTGKEEK